MTPPRFRLSQLSTLGLILCQALGLSATSTNTFAQAANGAKPSLPTPMSTQALIGLDIPPQMVIVPQQAIPTSAAPSNLNGNSAASAAGQASDLIRLYQEAAFSDPVLNAARFNYKASKELYWQGLSLLLPQASASPIGTRYYQHATNGSALTSYSGNSRVFDQKGYTVTLTQPVFNVAAFEASKQGDLNTKIAVFQALNNAPVCAANSLFLLISFMNVLPCCCLSASTPKSSGKSASFSNMKYI